MKISCLSWGSVSEPFGDDFGTILGRFWDHFGTFLGPFSEDFKSILEQFWRNFRTYLGHLAMKKHSCFSAVYYNNYIKNKNNCTNNINIFLNTINCNRTYDNY